MKNIPATNNSTEAGTASDTALCTATGTDYAFFGETRLIAPRRGWVDAMQDRYRIRGTAAGVNVEDTTAQTMYHLRPQAKVTIRKFENTYTVIFDPADVVMTETCGPRRDTPDLYGDGPLLDYFGSREFHSHVRAGKRRGWQF